MLLNVNHILSRFWRRFSTYFHEPHSFAYKKPMWFTYHTWTTKSFGFPTKLFLLWWPKWKWYFFSLRRTPPNVLSPFLLFKYNLHRSITHPRDFTKWTVLPHFLKRSEVIMCRLSGKPMHWQLIFSVEVHEVNIWATHFMPLRCLP